MKERYIGAAVGASVGVVGSIGLGISLPAGAALTVLLGATGYVAGWSMEEQCESVDKYCRKLKVVGLALEAEGFDADDVVRAKAKVLRKHLSVAAVREQLVSDGCETVDDDGDEDSPRVRAAMKLLKLAKKQIADLPVAERAKAEQELQAAIAAGMKA